MDASALSVRKWWRGPALAALGALVIGGVFFGRIAAASVFSDPEGSFNQPGNVLIADQFNNRVVELDAENDVVWQFGLGPNDLSPQSIIGVNDAERVGTLTLMAGTGVPAATPPLEPGCASGCADNRVVLVDRSGHIRWQ